MFANGKDPYFAPWPDVVQVNAFAPSLRSLAAAALSRIAEHADAVRCDMAMLMLDDVVTATWGERVGPPPADDVLDRGDRRGAGAVNPAFRFVAEAYWDREWDLQQLGFDYCYDKRLYDRLAQGDVAQVRGHLDADPAYQERLVRFLENHDEPRAARTFDPPARAKAAAVTIATLPGLTLWHDGQADGRQVFVPVFLGRRPDEPLDAGLAEWYRDLWAAAPRVRAGSLGPLRGDGLAGQHQCGGAGGLDLDGCVTPLSLVVVNLTGQPADGVVHVGHARPPAADGCSMTCSTARRTSAAATTWPTAACTWPCPPGAHTSSPRRRQLMTSTAEGRAAPRRAVGRLAAVGSVSQRAAMGDGPGGLQRQRRRVELLHPRPGPFPRLPLGRGRPGRASATTRA